MVMQLLQQKPLLKKRCSKISESVTFSSQPTQSTVVFPTTTSTTTVPRKNSKEDGYGVVLRNLGGVVVVTIFLGTLFVALLAIKGGAETNRMVVNGGNTSSSSPPSPAATTTSVTGESVVVVAPYSSCPIPLTTPSKDDVDMGRYIRQSDKHNLNEKNVSELWNWVTQSTDVDDWHLSYDEQRDRHYNFTVKEVVPHVVRTYINNGNDNKSSKEEGEDAEKIHIYESACGVGRNLVITLDIIHEVLHHQNGNNDNTEIISPTIVVHGNDYAIDSANAARLIFDTLQPYGSQVGTICGGVDSTNLSHIPSNSYDVVLTGYIAPIHNPLNLGINDKWMNKFKYRQAQYVHLCNVAENQHGKYSNEQVEEARANVQTMNTIQEEWFAKWIKEMVRIAKPGGPIFVEEVPFAKCNATNDNGGVNYDFWYKSTSWNNGDDDKERQQIDPTSIRFMPIIEKDGSPITRYNVAMRKKNGKEIEVM